MRSMHESMARPYKVYYCIVHGQIKGFNSSITTIILLLEVVSYRTAVG